MIILLQEGWDKKGAKLVYKVYLLGPKEKELVNEVHDKIY